MNIRTSTLHLDIKSPPANQGENTMVRGTASPARLTQYRDSHCIRTHHKTKIRDTGPIVTKAHLIISPTKTTSVGTIILNEHMMCPLPDSDLLRLIYGKRLTTISRHQIDVSIAIKRFVQNKIAPGVVMMLIKTKSQSIPLDGPKRSDTSVPQNSGYSTSLPNPF